MEKNPMQAVVEEVATTSALSPDEIHDALVGIGEMLKARALQGLHDLGEGAEEAANQFLAYSELILSYGTALIAIDDIEEEEMGN